MDNRLIFLYLFTIRCDDAEGERDPVNGMPVEATSLAWEANPLCFKDEL